MPVKIKIFIAALFSVAGLTTLVAMADEPANARGKYLVEIGGCNDCHTAGFAESGARTPEAEWLAGDSLGFRGPWGTTYPVNLRTYVWELGEDDWVTVSKTLTTRPPMPWWALNAMSEDDLRAMFRYIRALGPVDKAVPAYVPPNEVPSTPYIQWPAPPD